MKAVIYCNDEKTRQGDIFTGTKALLPICGRYALSYVFDTLSVNEISEALIVTDNTKLRQAFSSYLYKDISVDFLSDGELAGFDFKDDILFVQDISLFSFNLDEAYEKHRAQNSSVSVITKSADISDSGIWIISEGIINEFLKSFESGEKFPADEYKISTIIMDGYWQPLGSVNDILKCSGDILMEKTPFNTGGHKMLSGIVTADLTEYPASLQLSPPVYIGKGVSIGDGSEIGANTVIGNNVTIGKNVKLHNCIIMDGVYIGDRAECGSAIICKNAVLLNSCVINENCVVGENAVIGENAVVKAGVRIWNNKRLRNDSIADFDVRFGQPDMFRIGEDGITGETNGEFTSFTAVKTGSSLVNAGKNIAVGYKADSPASHCCALAICAGIASAGGNAMLVGECIENELTYITRRCNQNLGVFVDANSYTKIKLVSKDGLPLSKYDETAIESGLSGNITLRASYFNFGEIISASQLTKLYGLELSRLAPQRNSVNFDISTSNRRLKKLCGKIIRPRNTSGEKLLFQISADGKKAAAYLNETGFVFYEKLVAICCEELFKEGRDVALPFSFSLRIDDIATNYNRKVFRYHEYSNSAEDAYAKQLSAEQQFANDGIILMLTVLNIINETGQSFVELVDNLPKTFTSSRFVSCDEDDFEFIKQMSSSKNFRQEGVWVRDKKGEIFISPSKTGRSVRIFAESFSSETAAELCDSFENIIKTKLMS